MGKRYIIGALAAVTLVISGCNPVIDPAPGWDEPSAYLVRNIEEEEFAPQLGGLEGQDDTEEFLRELDAFRSRQGFDLARFLEDSRKSEGMKEQLYGAYPPEVRVRAVLSYFDMAGLYSPGPMIRSLERLAFEEKDRLEGCTLPDYWRTYPMGWYGGYSCLAGEATRPFFWWDRDDRLYFGGRNDEEIRGVLFNALNELGARAEEKEAATELFMGDAMLDSLSRVTGTELEVDVELVPINMEYVEVTDTLTGEVLPRIYIASSREETVWKELDSLIERFPRYAYTRVGFGGLSSDPVIVAPSDLLDTLHIIGHEYMHHVYYARYAEHPDSRFVHEHAIVDIYGWLAAWDAIDRFYVDSLDVEQREEIDSIRPLFFGEDGTLFPEGSEYGGVPAHIFLAVQGYAYPTPEMKNVIDLYNCIGDPERALDVFMGLNDDRDVQRELDACLLGSSEPSASEGHGQVPE